MSKNTEAAQMPDELLPPCPFCTKVPSTENTLQNYGKVHCTGDGCPIAYHRMTPEQWRSQTYLPPEPTDEMIAAGVEAIIAFGRVSNGVCNAWRRMVEIAKRADRPAREVPDLNALAQSVANELQAFPEPKINGFITGTIRFLHKNGYLNHPAPAAGGDAIKALEDMRSVGSMLPQRLQSLHWQNYQKVSAALRSSPAVPPAPTPPAGEEMPGWVHSAQFIMDQIKRKEHIDEKGAFLCTDDGFTIHVSLTPPTAQGGEKG